MTAPPGESVIALARVPGGWRNRYLRYQVILDGKQAATISRGERLDLAVTPGQHVIFLRAGSGRSPQLQVDTAPGEVITLECAPASHPPVGAGANAYIELRPGG